MGISGTKIAFDVDIIIQMNLLDEDKSSLLKSDQTLIGVLNPYENKKKLHSTRDNFVMLITSI